MNKKRILSLIITLFMLLSISVVPSFAREKEEASASVGCDPIWFEVQDLLDEAYVLVEAEDEYTYESRMILLEIANSVDVLSSNQSTVSMLNNAIAALVPIGSDSQVIGLLGDSDNNSKVDIRDVTLVQKYVAGFLTMDETQLVFADGDRNGDVDVRDATIVQKYVADLLPEMSSVGRPFVANPETYRYYFYMPESWYNDYTAKTGNTAGIYWWDGTNACDSWPGIPAKKGDVEGVYYYDVPKDVSVVIWNNYVDGGSDIYEEKYYYSQQTINIGTEYYDPGESDFYPDGNRDFDGMIYVTDPSILPWWSDYNGRYTFVGEWFYYYGGGEYGTAKVKGESKLLAGDTVDLESLREDNAAGSVQTRRYYFYLPDEWLNESTAKTGNTAGIYWWEGTNYCESWPGIPAKKADAVGVYYYDVPCDVTEIVWNNYFDGGDDFYEPYFVDAIGTTKIDVGSENYEGMIFVVDFVRYDYNEYTGKLRFYGEWFYYYGNGEYGTTPVRGDGEIYNDYALNRY